MPSGRARGAYIILFRLDRDEDVMVGKLGAATFPQGTYAYVGSAMGGLEARVRRHLDGGGKKHWHIDHLIELSNDREAMLFPSRVDRECEINAMVSSLPGSRIVLKGFGSSDCRCPAHLHLLSEDGEAALRNVAGPRMRPSRTAREHLAGMLPEAPSPISGTSCQNV